MFTIEQLKNAYAWYVSEHRETPEKFMRQEDADKLSVSEEADRAIDCLVAVMEGRDPFE